MQRRQTLKVWGYSDSAVANLIGFVATFGGTTASFAMLGDIICGEPNALIGFAGPRVIKETIKKNLPPVFSAANFYWNMDFLTSLFTANC